MDSIVNWVNQGKKVMGAWHNGTDIFISTLEGEMRASVGDWIIKGVNGDFILVSLIFSIRPMNQSTNNILIKGKD